MNIPNAILPGRIFLGAQLRTVGIQNPDRDSPLSAGDEGARAQDVRRHITRLQFEAYMMPAPNLVGRVCREWARKKSQRA